MVADSQPIDRRGMRRLLEEHRDFEVVAESSTVPETIERCRELGPAVLVLSLNLSGQEHGPAIPAIRAALPSLAILALSERGANTCLVLNPPGRRHLSPDLVPACALGTDCLELAAAQGARGTLRRHAEPEALILAIRAVAAGHASYDSTAPRERSGGGALGRPGAPLSARELEVAALIAEGRSNKEISTALGIGEPTVKKHVGRLIAKLGLADRLQVGLFLARHPLVFHQGPRVRA